MSNQGKPTAMVPAEKQHALAASDANEYGFTKKQVDLIKQTIVRGASDDELHLFMYTAKSMELDPFARQIFSIKRYDSTLAKEVMAIQVSIDGLRLVADRTGCYAPGSLTRFVLNKDEQVVSAIASVKKFVRGEWHVVEAEANWDEYVGRKRDGSPNRMWSDKPRIMLGKCAEAIALRKAFPAELSGVYAPEEIRTEEPEYHAPVAVPVITKAPIRMPDGSVLEANMINMDALRAEAKRLQEESKRAQEQPIATVNAETGEVLREPGCDDDEPVRTTMYDTTTGDAVTVQVLGGTITATPLDALKATIAAAQSEKDLMALISVIKKRPKAEQDDLRPLYSARKKEIGETK